jgi:hypothetical protein
MLNRRDMLAAGLFGGLAPSGEGEMQNTGEVILREGLNKLDNGVEELRGSVDQGLRGNSMNFGGTAIVKQELLRYLKTSGKFPEYCDIGVNIFFDVYDWHVRNQQQIQISRLADQRMSIQFMFTQLVLRWENAENYVSQAYDR